MIVFVVMGMTVVLSVISRAHFSASCENALSAGSSSHARRRRGIASSKRSNQYRAAPIRKFHMGSSAPSCSKGANRSTAVWWSWLNEDFDESA